MARRNWSPVPHTVLRGSSRSELVLSLPLETRAIYLSLWVIADSHGRFCAGPHNLRAELGYFTGDLEEQLSRLDGLVQLFEVDGQRYGQIVGHGDDLPSELRKRRGDSSLPDPPEDVPLRTNSALTAQSVRSVSAVSPTHREEKRREEKNPPSGGDARAREAPPSGPAETGGGVSADNAAPSLAASPAPADKGALSLPAQQWLERRVEVSQRNGNSFATADEALDLHGPELLRLQTMPGFTDAVEAMLRKPDKKWGKRLSSGIGLLRSIVTDHVEEQRAPPGQSGRQAHMGDGHLTLPGYRAKYGRLPSDAKGTGKDVFSEEPIA